MLQRRLSLASTSHAAIAGALSLLSFFVAGCAGEVNVSSPEDGNGQRPEKLTIDVRLASADSALASALGWTEGRVPDAHVSLLRETSGGGFVLEEETGGRSDSTGTVEFTDLFPGNTYRVRVL